jgi:hypothetical protein
LTRLPLALSMLLLVALPAAAQSPEVTIKVAPESVAVGEIVTATVSITYADGVTVSLPADGADFGDAEVRSATVTTEPLADSRSRTVGTYEVVLWEVGEHALKAPAATWRAGEGEVQEAARPEATVTVASVLTEATSEIADIRGPREMPLKPVHYLLAALPVLALIGLIVGLVMWLRGRRRRQAPEEALPPLEPAEEALLALDQLESDDLVAQDQIKEHYVRLSWILRRYIDRRWGLPALEETTGMLGHTMRGSGRVPEAQIAEMIAVLRRADLAKFAKFRPEPIRAREDVGAVRAIVNATKPREEVPEEVAAQAASSAE